jgi:DNA-binding transcriptional MerR regulator
MTRRDSHADLALRVGELAERAGVSVRTLHHYEAIGLLVPSARTDAGHRRYARSDIARLARIRALTALGFSLDEVRVCLDDEAWSDCAPICAPAATTSSTSSRPWR